eukprot:4289251-Prymnesium_polylepis.1
MSDVQKVFRVADAISQCSVLLEEDVGVIPAPDDVLYDRFPPGPLGAFQSRMNELLRRSDLGAIDLDREPTLREIEGRIQTDGDEQLSRAPRTPGWTACCTAAFGAGWLRSVVGGLRDTLPTGWLRHVATSRPRAVAEGVRLVMVGVLVLLVLTGYLLKPSAEMGVAPYAPPPPPLAHPRGGAGGRRGVRHRSFRKGPIEDLVELQPYRLPRKGDRRGGGEGGGGGERLSYNATAGAQSPAQQRKQAKAATKAMRRKDGAPPQGLRNATQAGLGRRMKKG